MTRHDRYLQHITLDTGHVARSPRSGVDDAIVTLVRGEKFAVKDSRSLLQQAGEALYGPHWQTELASKLGVTYRTMRRWVSGSHAIPSGIWPEINALIIRRGHKLATISHDLDLLLQPSKEV